MLQERRFISDLSLLPAAHCGYCDHRSIAFLPMNVETLRQVPLFESLDTEAAHELCELLESLDCKAGAVLFRAGDEGDAMYLIEEGKVRIWVRAKEGNEVTLPELHAGIFLGKLPFSMVSRAQPTRGLPRTRGWLCFRASIFLRLLAATQMS